MSYRSPCISSGRYDGDRGAIPFDQTDIQIAENQPWNFELLPNFPNPFNASTTISYNLPVPSSVTLNIYDILGRKVQTLFDGYRPAGKYSEILLDKDIPSGVYLYKFTAGEYQQTRKMMLIK